MGKVAWGRFERQSVSARQGAGRLETARPVVAGKDCPIGIRPGHGFLSWEPIQ
jgi:hypothetical protein